MNLDLDDLLPLFVAEAEERLDAMEQALVALEAGTVDAELLSELFRGAHTLKGNAASLGFTAIAEVTHVLEDLLEPLTRHALQPTRGFVTLMLDAVDVLRGQVERAAAGDDVPAPGQAALLEALKRAAAGEVVKDAPREPEAAGLVGPGAETGAGRARSLRVGLDRLDQLRALAGEIAIARGRLGGLLEALGEPGADVREAHRDAERLDREMHELVMRTRMVPLGPSFRQHARMVRDVAIARGKQARLAIQGEEVEADLGVVEQLRDPLTHLIRNAIDHGVEPADQRRARGKNPVATITVGARHEAGRLVVEVSDDGAGLDRARILARARERGLIGEGQALGEREAHEIIFRPGFSTAESVTELSGRGIGMDVVRRNIATLRGSVEIASRAGEGTTLTIRLPLTLAVIPGFLVAAGEERYVLPLESVIECLDLPPGSADGSAGVTELRGEAVPYLQVRRVLGAAGSASPRESLVLVEHGDGVAGLVVDAVLGEAQVVVQPLASPLQHVRGVTGSTILGDGRVALMLDVAALLREAEAAALP
jgi:two-component system, chemotaxis family, sensor kinase CheA